MLVLRSVVFNVLFYLNTIVHAVGGLPALLMSRRSILGVAKSWGRTSNFLLRTVAGTTIDYRGLEKIPAGALHPRVEAPVGVGDLHAGRAARRAGLHPQARADLDPVLRLVPDQGRHDRGQSRRARRGAHQHDRRRAQGDSREGRQIIIFPEGTRRAPGAEPAYKYGVVHLYAETGALCVPVALNAGLFWPRRKFLRYPGTIAARGARSDPARASKGSVRRTAEARHRDRDRPADRRRRAGARAPYDDAACASCGPRSRSASRCRSRSRKPERFERLHGRRAHSRGWRRTGRGPAAPDEAASRDRAGRHIAGGRGRPCRRAPTRAAPGWPAASRRAPSRDRPLVTCSRARR